FTRLGVSELLEGLLFQVRAQLNGTPLTLSDDEGWRREDAEVLIDPGHLSRAFEVAVRRLTTHVGPESSVTVAIERSARRDRAGLEIGRASCRGRVWGSGGDMCTIYSSHRQ